MSHISGQEGALQDILWSYRAPSPLQLCSRQRSVLQPSLLASAPLNEGCLGPDVSQGPHWSPRDSASNVLVYMGFRGCWDEHPAVRAPLRWVLCWAGPVMPQPLRGLWCRGPRHSALIGHILMPQGPQDKPSCMNSGCPPAEGGVAGSHQFGYLGPVGLAGGVVLRNTVWASSTGWNRDFKLCFRSRDDEGRGLELSPWCWGGCSGRQKSSGSTEFLTASYNESKPIISQWKF